MKVIVSILKAIVLTAVLLLIVLVANTLRFSSTQIRVDPVAPITVDSEAAAQHLSGAIAFRTISHENKADFQPQPFLDLQQYLKASFPLVHATMTLERINQFSLLYTWKGSDESLNPILMLAHTDVVPVAPGTQQQWTHDAFSGRIEGGFVWGRGALDDKVNVVAMLESAEMLIGEGFQPRRSILFAFGHDEEIFGTAGAVAIAALLEERGIEAEFVIDEGSGMVQDIVPGLSGKVALIGIAEKGFTSMTLTVQTQGGHSSQPPPETAIGILSKAVHRLEENQLASSLVGPTGEMLRQLGPEMPFALRVVMANLWLTEPILLSQFLASTTSAALIRTTTAPTLFNAGIKDNVLPAEANATINFRILPGDTIDSIEAHIREVVDDGRVKIQRSASSREASKVSPSSVAAFKIIERTIREVFPDTLTSPSLVIVGTDSRNYGAISDNIYRFAPYLLQPEDLQRIHGVDERISVVGLGRMIEFYHRLILNSTQ